MGISGEDVEGSRHLGIDTGKRDQFFISAAQLVFPSYCLDQRCRGGCDQLQGIDWNGHRPARPTKAAELGTCCRTGDRLSDSPFVGCLLRSLPTFFCLCWMAVGEG